MSDWTIDIDALVLEGGHMPAHQAHAIRLHLEAALERLIGRQGLPSRVRDATHISLRAQVAPADWAASPPVIGEAIAQSVYHVLMGEEGTP